MRLLLVIAIALASCQKSAPEPAAEPVRAAVASDAVELVGQPAPDWIVGEWHGRAPISLADLRGRVVVVRFWTDTCPYCEASLPALETIARDFADQPVTVLGLYHSKPRGSERPWQGAIDRARELGVTFPIAYDRDWQTVRRWWLDGRPRAATSASFVIGKDGRIAHVHKGPSFYPSDNDWDSDENAAYQAIRAAIERALEG